MLSEEQLHNLATDYFADQWAADKAVTLMKEIESEVCKQDDALILQLVEALESARVWKCKEIHHMMREAQYTPAIQAARARLGEKT